MTFWSEDEAVTLNSIASMIHDDNKRWWRDPKTKKPIERNIGELLMLCVSELSEALEGHRKDLMDDKLPHRKMFEVELADCVIRIFDLAHGLGYSIGDAVIQKLIYNQTREDHTDEHRLKEGGKKY